MARIVFTVLMVTSLPGRTPTENGRIANIR